MRWGDARMVNESKVDEYLFLIQRDLFGGWIFACLGDSAFKNGLVLFHNNDINLKGVRIAVEWSYVDVASLWKICDRADMNRLLNEADYAIEQLRICYLLTNCYVCLNGSHVTQPNFFGTVPSTLEEYLHL